ncbi:transcriptional regulator with XRE-family HTH domain [Actinoplanes campanulatus]|uniref:Transcriptional regulator with XRE-family HTH domain n=1 Tax=Actinoplanes campanulatus TaxID=113559 RepID=A0A7W5ALS7_9ACTN|nr:helix-turn-helix transcriptional regulator [Actinoplanes campanulatus]MBB3098612.1 transcriptional regulator with XRE-family HTH domain [Actinoplanes campanulatus]GGN36140.1 transcriptional regulator [Actinoplanes campanulatus]GID39303.1 transcriptional regulator [Actinoplanes campanulatus]
MSGSPDSLGRTTDEPVGVVLARLRKSKRIPGQALGERVGMSQAKISRLETGAVAAEPADVRLLAEELGLPPDEVDQLVTRAEHADNRLTDWRPAHLGLAERQRDLRQLEVSTLEHRVFQPAVVPGLLQTSEYARAVMSDLHTELDDARVADSAVAVSEAVTARMNRNQILLLPDRAFVFLITEAVLRNRIGRPAEMIAQIGRIREVAAYPNVTLRIVPDDAEWPIAPYHGFYLADDRCVLVDLFNTSMISRGRRIVRSYRRVFDAIERVATADAGPTLDRYQTHYARMLLNP